MPYPVSGFRWRSSRRLVFVAIGGCLGTLGLASEKSSSYTAALESIRSAELQQHVGALASDAMEGRESGTRGSVAAAEYLASQFARFRLPGAGSDGQYFQPFEPNFRNVLARLEGRDPQLKGQTVLVGAHYDHVGRGNERNSRGPVGHIHNGADDNASGVSAVLELAEAFSTLAAPPKRTILFAGWDAEEKGLLGAKHWVGSPTVPLDGVVAVLNLDMIGRLREERVKVFGSRSGYGLRRLVSTQNEDAGLLLDFSWNMAAKADHYPFFVRGRPVLMFHTGLHDDYHRPSDDAERIDHQGIQRVARLLFAIAYELAESDSPPRFRTAAERENADVEQGLFQPPPMADRLGMGWESAHDGGARVNRLVIGGPAQRAGVQLNDRILRFADRAIQTADDLSGAVAAATTPAQAVIQRAGRPEPLELAVPLDGKPLRVGITWHVDEAEPGTVVLTHVVPGSPAAAAGLSPGDRVYRVAGQDFADDTRLAELIHASSGPLQLLVERNGRLRTVLVHFRSEPLKRAA